MVFIKRKQSHSSPGPPFLRLPKSIRDSIPGAADADSDGFPCGA